MSEEKKFYVYEYIDPMNGEVIYIGKGCGDRKDWYWANRNTKDGYDHPFRKRLRKIEKQGTRPKVRTVESNLTEQESFDLEVFLIAEYGRRDLGTGSLWNLTDGGEGASGHLWSEERGVHMSNALKQNFKDNPERAEDLRDFMLDWWENKEDAECDVCGVKGKLTEVFTRNHYQNCTKSVIPKEDKYKPFPESDSRTGINDLIDKCQNFSELELMRYFYGYTCNPERNDDHPDNYYINYTNSIVEPLGEGKYRFNSYIPKISDELFEYSLKGLESFDIFDD